MSGMMKKPFFHSLVLSFMLALASPAQTLVLGHWTYFLNGSNEATIIGYSGPGGAVDIPSTLDGKPVRQLGGAGQGEEPQAGWPPIFGTFNTTVTSVIIPNGVTKIGDYAFIHCIRMTSITIPNSVTHIGLAAFNGCEELLGVTIPDSVTSLGAVAFSSCPKLSSVTIPNSVTSIGQNTFSGCSALTGVTIPSSVTSIGDSAFHFCTGLTSVTIPDSVTSIGTGAFGDCWKLASVTLSNNLTSIGNYLFMRCYKLAGVTIPDSVTSIGSLAFGSCFKLASVTIPSSVTSIGQEAFSYCGSLTSVNIPSSVTNIDAGAFAGCTGLSSAAIPNSVTSIADFTFFGCTGLTGVTIPDSVTNIGNYAFHGCTGLTSVTIPDSVTNIRNHAFHGCTGLTGVIIPDSVAGIGSSAFAHCTGLISAVIGSNVADISNGLFLNCTGLTSVYFRGNLPAMTEGGISALQGIPQGSVFINAGSTGWGAEFEGWPIQVFAPRAHSPTRGNNGGFSFLWSGTGSIPMDVERADSPGGPWTVVANGIRSGQFTDAVPPAVKAFYRAVPSTQAAAPPAPPPTPPGAPTAITAAAAAVTGSSATLNGSGNPNNASTTAWFRYSTSNPGTADDSSGTRTPSSGGSPLGAGSSSVAFSQALTALSPGTTYYYWAVTQSTNGTAFGSIQSFTTAASPQATTAAASEISSSTATLNGSGNPSGVNTTGGFRYSTSNPGTANGSSGIALDASSNLGSGSSPVAYSQSVTGLLPGTTYYYWAFVENPNGTAFGSIQSFTTAATVPTATTGSVSNLTGTSATLGGSANPGGASTTAWFRYSTSNPGNADDSSGTRTPSSGGSSLGAGTSGVTFSQALADLDPGTTYYYWAIAASAEGTAFGSIQSFTTPAPPTGNSLITVSGGTLPQSSQIAGTSVESFQIGKYEVTFGEWQEVVAWAVTNGYSDLADVGTGSTGNHPVHSVGWYDVVKWCNARSEKEGLVPVYQLNGAVYRTGQSDPTLDGGANGYRLPSEAEWEWAARGGASSQGYTYSGGNDLDAVAWSRENSSGAPVAISGDLGTWPVGEKTANELGIHDMSGNVWEWTEDAVIDSGRRLRGGSWNDFAANGCEVAHRGFSIPPFLRNASIGFRVVRDVP